MEWILSAAGIVVSIVLAAGGFFMNHLNEKFNMHTKRVDDIESDVKKLPETYARRDDVKSKFDEVLASLNRIDGKLDNMKDQRYHG